MTIALVILFLILIGLGAPLVFALAIPSWVYLALSDKPMAVLAQQMYSGADSFPLLAIPFFLLAGDLMARSGITDRIVDFSNRAVGWIRGGLGQANILAEMLLSGITGSAVADSVAVGRVMVPAMEREGYDRAEAAAITAAGSVMGPIIPPSIGMVIYGASVNQSIGALFAAGLVPGVLIGVGLMACVYWRSRKHDAIKRYPFSVRHLLVALVKATIPLLMLVLLVGGILSGVFTPTEAGAVACLYAVLIGVAVLRTLTVRDLWAALVETAKGTCVVMLIVIAANPFSWILSVNQVPQSVASLFVGADVSPWIFLILVNVALLIAGMLMETTANILILAPIFLPAAVAMGIDPIHFSMVFLVNLFIGLITPPIGLVLFSTAAVANVSFGGLVARIGPYLAVELAVLALIVAFPALTITVPRLLNLY